MQIKATMGHHFTPIRMPLKQTTANAGEDAEKGRTLIHLVGLQNGTTTFENSLQFLKKLNMKLR